MWLSMAGRARARLGPAQADHSSPLLVSPRNLPVISPNLPAISPSSLLSISPSSSRHLFARSPSSRHPRVAFHTHTTHRYLPACSPSSWRLRGALLIAADLCGKLILVDWMLCMFRCRTMCESPPQSPTMPAAPPSSPHPPPPFVILSASCGMSVS